MKNIIAAVVAGLIMFFWGFVSWSQLNWHETDVYKFADEQAVVEALIENAPESGIYYIPGNEEDLKPGSPSGMANVMKDGFQIGLGQMMIQGVIASILMAYIAIMLLCKTSITGTMQKVGFITLTGLLIGISSSFMYWNWMGFPSGHSLVNLLDTVITWALAGVAIAYIADTD